MSTTSSAQDSVAAALEQALASPTVGSQSTTVASPEVKSTSTPSDAGDKSIAKGPDSKVESKSVPYDRFSEVVSQKNDALERIKALEGMFDGATKREDGLRSRVGELEKEHTILDAIRNLANDERYRPHVVAIDKALQGATEEVAEAKATGDDQAIKAAEKRLADKVSQLENLVAEQNAEGLWDAANAAASQMLQSLPDEYTDVDKARLSQLWTPRVNWDHIEDKGRDSILPALKESFAQLIRDYGQPQGAVAKTTRDEVLKTVPAAAAAQQTPEQRVSGILGKNWSETGEKGAVVHSDADFAKSMADLIRVTRGG